MPLRQDRTPLIGFGAQFFDLQFQVGNQRLAGLGVFGHCDQLHPQRFQLLGKLSGFDFQGTAAFLFGL